MKAVLDIIDKYGLDYDPPKNAPRVCLIDGRPDRTRGVGEADRAAIAFHEAIQEGQVMDASEAMRLGCELVRLAAILMTAANEGVR